MSRECLLSLTFTLINAKNSDNLDYSGNLLNRIHYQYNGKNASKNYQV